MRATRGAFRPPLRPLGRLTFLGRNRYFAAEVFTTLVGAATIGSGRLGASGAVRTMRTRFTLGA